MFGILFSVSMILLISLYYGVYSNANHYPSKLLFDCFKLSSCLALKTRRQKHNWRTCQTIIIRMKRTYYYETSLSFCLHLCFRLLSIVRKINKQLGQWKVWISKTFFFMNFTTIICNGILYCVYFFRLICSYYFTYPISILFFALTIDQIKVNSVLNVMIHDPYF